MSQQDVTGRDVTCYKHRYDSPHAAYRAGRRLWPSKIVTYRCEECRAPSGRRFWHWTRDLKRIGTKR